LAHSASSKDEEIDSCPKTRYSRDVFLHASRGVGKQCQIQLKNDKSKAL